MTDATLIANHRSVQCAAKAVLAALSSLISSRDTEKSIADIAHGELRSLGYAETWYYSCPALVLLGSRSCVSLSGRDYQPALEPLGDRNLVTVDLSPVRNGYWGDCARSFYVEEGVVVNTPHSPDFAAGKAFLEVLHSEMKARATPEMTFGELFLWGNERIKSEGFENLDFLGNLGHSIADALENRQYIEASNRCRLSCVSFFTFEPHIRKSGGRWGFKHEDIFFFDQNGQLQVL